MDSNFKKMLKFRFPDKCHNITPVLTKNSLFSGPEKLKPSILFGFNFIWILYSQHKPDTIISKKRVELSNLVVSYFSTGLIAYIIGKKYYKTGYRIPENTKKTAIVW